MSTELTDEVKQAFKDATERRKAAGIKLRKISFMADERDVNWFHMFFDEWVVRWGKDGAVECLIYVMMEAEKAYRQHKKEAPKFKRVSAKKQP